MYLISVPLSKRCGFLELAAPGLAEERTEWFEMFVEQRFFRRAQEWRGGEEGADKGGQWLAIHARSMHIKAGEVLANELQKMSRTQEQNDLWSLGSRAVIPHLFTTRSVHYTLALTSKNAVNKLLK